MLNQPTSSPMMTTMLGLRCCAAAGRLHAVKIASKASVTSQIGLVAFITLLRWAVIDGPTALAQDGGGVAATGVAAKHDGGVRSRAPGENHVQSGRVAILPLGAMPAA